MIAVEESTLISALQMPASREQAFGQLVQQHQQALYYHIRRMVVDHEDADDVLQNTFMKAWRGLDGFRGEAKLKTWLYRIATNESLTFLQKKKRRHYQGIDNLQDDLRHSLAQTPYVSGEEIQVKLQAAVLQLPERQRLVFNMRYYDEMKYDDISAVLGVTTGALKASYHHAVKKIEKLLTESTI
ncbi:MAG: RNA polymerase sigma factor [Bacteroidota bacterium]